MTTDHIRYWQDLTTADFGSLDPARLIAILPLGAIEQHGPHLPFNTDLVIPSRTAEELVERVGDELDLWLLPPLAYTKSNEHAWAPGTVCEVGGTGRV